MRPGLPGPTGVEASPPGGPGMKAVVLADGGAHDGGGGRLRGTGARAFGGAGAWLWASTEAVGQRKKRASHLYSGGFTGREASSSWFSP
jgi:hypothetical protein